MNAPPSNPDRMVGRRAMERLRAAAERRPRIAVMGEFSAGKSTLINALVGRTVAPIRVTATQASPLWISHGDEAAAEVVERDGARRSIDPDAVREVDPSTARLVRLRLPSPFLSRFDVIDTPGLLDPLMSEDLLDRAARLADMAVWCTSAVQAWRRSEEAAWSGLPARLRRRGVLVVTHIDRLKETDRAKVIARLDRETEGKFRTTVPVSAKQAAQARLEDAAEDWAASGGEELQSVLLGLAGEVETERRSRLSRYAVSADDPTFDVPSADDAPEDPASTEGDVPDAPAEHHSPLSAFDAELSSLPDRPTSDDLRAFGERVVARVGDEDGGGTWSQLLLDHRFEDAEPRRVLRQMRGEIADFTADEWCSLVPAPGPGPADGA